MKTYLHTYGLTNGQTWSIELKAKNWKEASKEGNAHARIHAKYEHTQLE